MSTSIEQLIAANTAALIANTAALTAAAGGSTAAAADKPAADKPAATTTRKTTTKKAADAEAPKTSRTDLAAALNEVKEQKGASVAKALIKEHGKSDKLAEVADANVDALYAAAKEELGEGDDDGAGEGDL